MMVELKLKCALIKRKLESKDLFELIMPLLPIAAVTAQIQQLASFDKLNELDNNLKNEYKENFEPIPHADLLPTNYTARIKLRDVEKTILSRSYTCPWQFKDAFATLIEQHLDSGFIW